MAWRRTIKTFFADLSLDGIPGINKFGDWNQHKTNYNTEETLPELTILFEYSTIGDGFEYLLQRDMQQSERVPVQVTLHIVFNNYNDQAQDLAYDYANKITCAIVGKKHELIHGRILKTSEVEDINHRAQYDYKISFAFNIKDAVFVDQLSTDANPVDETGNPDTGRRLQIELEPSIILNKEGVGYWAIEGDFVVS